MKAEICISSEDGDVAPFFISVRDIQVANFTGEYIPTQVYVEAMHPLLTATYL